MHDDTQSVPALAASDLAPAKITSSQRVRSDELFRGASEIVIEHNGRQYQLRITQNGKLILTA